MVEVGYAQGQTSYLLSQCQVSRYMAGQISSILVELLV